jgi:ADP-heptose:LPS heptosyltransferase
MACTPIPHALKDKYPDCHITLLTSEDYVDIFSGNPYIDTLKVTPSVKAHIANGTKTYDTYLVRELTTNIDDYDILYELNTLIFWGEYRRTGLTLTDHYAAMADVYPLGDRPYEIYADKDKEKAHFAKVHPEIIDLLDQEPIIVHGAGGWDLKVMPWFKWLDVFKYLENTMGDHPIIFVGKEDGRIPSHIKEKFKDMGKVVHDAIDLPIKTQYWLIDQAYMYVGPDSGPMHCAGATRTPIMAYYAGTSQFVAPPRSEYFTTMQSDASCGVPCGIGICRTHELCAKMIEPYHVAQAILKLNGAIKAKRPIQKHYRGLNETEHYFYKWEHLSIDHKDPQFDTWMDEGESLDPNWNPNN